GGHNIQKATPEICNELMKFIVYDIERNRWIRLKNPQWYADLADKITIGNVHGYQLQTIAPGRFLRAYAGNLDIQVCNINKDQVADIDPRDNWQELSGPFKVGPHGITTFGFLEYFPERKSLLLLDSASGTLYEKVLADPKWTMILKNTPEL